jgi:hypothetical protein
MGRSDLHARVLERWVGTLYGGDADRAGRLGALRKMAGTCAPTGAVWRAVLDREEDEGIAQMVHEAWRAIGAADAALGWAQWLLRHGQGARAARVVDGAADDAVTAAWAEVLRTRDLDLS